MHIHPYHRTFPCWHGICPVFVDDGIFGPKEPDIDLLKLDQAASWYTVAGSLRWSIEDGDIMHEVQQIVNDMQSAIS